MLAQVTVRSQVRKFPLILWLNFAVYTSRLSELTPPPSGPTPKAASVSRRIWLYSPQDLKVARQTLTGTSNNITALPENISSLQLSFLKLYSLIKYLKSQQNTFSKPVYTYYRHCIES